MPVTSKQQKYDGQNQQYVNEFQQKQGWQLASTHGSAKIVKGWSQAGYGGWYGHGSDKNFSVFVRLAERQSNNRAGLRAVLKVLPQKQLSEKLHVIVDAEIVYSLPHVIRDDKKYGL